MTIRREHAPRNLVNPARQVTDNTSDERMNIVRIGRNPKLTAASVRPAKRDLAQLGHNLLAEHETNRLGRLSEMALRRRCRAEQGRVQQHPGRGMRDRRAKHETEKNRRRSHRAATIKEESSATHASNINDGWTQDRAATVEWSVLRELSVQGRR